MDFSVFMSIMANYRLWHIYCSCRVLLSFEKFAAKDLITMKKKRFNLKNRNLNFALNRYITNELFEQRILEHPKMALERTSFQEKSQIICETKHKQLIKK